MRNTRTASTWVLVMMGILLFALSFLQDNYFINLSGIRIEDRFGKTYSAFLIPFELRKDRVASPIIESSRVFGSPLGLFGVKDIIFLVLFMAWTLGFVYLQAGKKALRLMMLFFGIWLLAIVVCYGITYGFGLHFSLIHMIGFMLFDTLKTYEYVIIIALLFLLHGSIRKQQAAKANAADLKQVNQP